MAVTYTLIDPGTVKANPGQTGSIIARLVLDGSTTSKAITLTADNSIRTIKAATGGTSNNIPVAGVAGTTGFTVKFAAGTNAEFLDVLIYGEG